MSNVELPAPSGREMLADRAVRRFLTAVGLTGLGVALQLAVVAKEIFDISGRESDLAWLGLAEFAPAPFLVFVTGTVADRFDRRKVSAIALGGETLCVLALAAYSLSDPTAVWPFFLISSIFGACRAFNGPSIRAMPPMITPDGGLSRLIAMNSMVSTSALILGAALSGVLYVLSPATAYFTAAAVMTIGLSRLMGITIRRQSVRSLAGERPTLRSAMEGLRFIRHTPILFAVITLDLFAVLFGGAVALLPAIAEERLGVGDIAYGWLRAAPGIGAGLTALLLAIRPLRRRIGWTLLGAVGVFGTATVALGLTSSYLVAFAALAVLSGADMVSVFIRASLSPLVTPDDKRGRVLAVEQVFIGASNELGAFESGMVAQHLGLQFAVVGGGAATLLVVVAFVVGFPALRRIDRFNDVEAPIRSP